MSSRSEMLSFTLESYPDSNVLVGKEQNYYVAYSEETQGGSSVESPFASYIDDSRRLGSTLEITTENVGVSNVESPFASNLRDYNQDSQNTLIYIIFAFILYKLL